MPLLLPFFKFNVTDWLTSEKIALMEAPHVGAYIMLLAQCWSDSQCSLPSDPAILKKLSKWDEGKYGDFGPVLACFIPLKKTGRLTNARLYQEWLDARQRTEVLSESGQRGAAKRWAIKPVVKKSLTTESVTNGRDYRSESKLVLAFLNEKTGKQFREVDSNLHFIEARLKSGIDVQTCKTLIARKVRDWTPKPEMLPYLRPETLFNKTKFETYLAEVTQ